MTQGLGQRPSIPGISQCELSFSSPYLVLVGRWKLAVRTQRSAKPRDSDFAAGEASRASEEYESVDEVSYW